MHVAVPVVTGIPLRTPSPSHAPISHRDPEKSTHRRHTRTRPRRVPPTGRAPRSSTRRIPATGTAPRSSTRPAGRARPQPETGPALRGPGAARCHGTVMRSCGSRHPRSAGSRVMSGAPIGPPPETITARSAGRPGCRTHPPISVRAYRCGRPHTIGPAGQPVSESGQVRRGSGGGDEARVVADPQRPAGQGSVGAGHLQDLSVPGEDDRVDVRS